MRSNSSFGAPERKRKRATKGSSRLRRGAQRGGKAAARSRKSTNAARSSGSSGLLRRVGLKVAGAAVVATTALALGITPALADDWGTSYDDYSWGDDFGGGWEDDFGGGDDFFDYDFSGGDDFFDDGFDDDFDDGFDDDFGDDFIKSAGVGARAPTPIGLVRLEVAFPLDRREEDDDVKIYFGLGSVF